MEINIEALSLELDKLISEIPGGGTALIQKCVEICKQQSIPKMWCWSGIDYEAVGFYDKMGFTEKTLMQKQFYGRDLWLLGKLID